MAIATFNTFGGGARMTEAALGPSARFDRLDHAPEPPAMSPANECVTDIMNALDQLATTIAGLENQLQPALSPAVPTNEKADRDNIRTTGSPLVEALRTMDSRIRSANQELQRISQRIEL